MKIKLSYQNRKEIDITKTDFAKRIAKAMDELKSSHVYFVMQQAYGEIGWEECQKILDIILNKKDIKQSLTS